MGRILRFDCFAVEEDAHQLFRHGRRIRLRDQSFRVLTLLMARQGEVVTREDLRRHLWANDTFVDFETGLNTAIGRLREALGDSADRPRYIETLPRVGYRFRATVTIAREAERRTAPYATTRLMVLPLTNANGDPSLDYFSDAISDEITAELAALSPGTLGVVARTTAMHYKGTASPVAEIAQELMLDWVLEGAVRRTGDRVSLTVQLIRTNDQTHVLARRFESGLADIFTMERAVAEAVGSALGLAGRPGASDGASIRETRRSRPPTGDVVAYTHYIQGRHHLEWGAWPQGLMKARSCLEAAVARDPSCALAHDALAEVWWHMGFLGIVAPLDALQIGLPHAERSVELDAGLAEAHSMLAQYRKQVAFDWPAVGHEMALALELNPASPVVRRRHAITGLMPHGRMSEAIRELEVALELDPLGVLSRAWLLVMYWLGRRYDCALEQGRILLEIEPRHFLTPFVMGLITREVRRFPEAIAALHTAVALAGGSPLMLGWLGLALAESGDAARARALLARLRTMPPRVYVPPTSLAWIHLALGETDECFAWMVRAVEARDHMITPIQTYPFLDALRQDARYEDLLRRMNLRS